MVRGTVVVHAPRDPVPRAPHALTCSASTTGRVPQHATGFSHSSWGQHRYAASKHRPWECVKVVEVHDAVARNAVGHRGELQFGNQVAFCASEGGHYHRMDPISHGISSQDQHRSIPSRRCGKPNLTSLHQPNPTSPRPGPSRQPWRTTPHRDWAESAPKPWHRPRWLVSPGIGGEHLSGTRIGPRPTPLTVVELRPLRSRSPES